MTLSTTVWRGTVYRGLHPAWAFAPNSGEGASKYGGRFNRPGLPCLYTALSPETAWLEAQQGFAFKAQPLTLCAYQVDCADIVDLGTRALALAAEIDPDRLACPWERFKEARQLVPSWAIADQLIAAGCAGMIVPSYAARAGSADRNLVLWRWSSEPPHRIVVVDDHDRLPRDQASWPAEARPPGG